FTATVGGVRVTEPAADLALALAVVSAATDRPLPPSLIVIGELGLSGDVRAVSGLGRRLAEAARLGYTRALVPVGTGPGPPGLETVEVTDLIDATQVLRSRVPPPRLHLATAAT
ncbi:MAG TPA: magnesium chelatase domain-containing protein, partial [Mycobacteriales bacterium]|nr:magnesium chelatase domain-containing protein [Mycobacteriales bacterium]